MIVRIQNSPSDSVSGYRGISSHTSGKWQAFLSVCQNGVKIKYHIGTYDTIEEAKSAREEYILGLL